MGSHMSNKRYLAILTGLFLIEAAIVAIKPWYPQDWMLENILPVVFLAYLWGTVNRLTMSKVSYTLIFIFLAFHEIGSHYTYAEVPYDALFKSLTGISFNELVGWERNNFDRVVHFLYGLLLGYPIRELYFRIADARGFWGYFLPLEFTMATSMLYELIEWGAANVVGGDLGMAYLGTQGDIWDAHKDMALASLGALIAMIITAAINYRVQKDFAREWSESFKVKSNTQDDSE
jgi:putative membrane protein